MPNVSRQRKERSREHLTPEEAVKLLEAVKLPGVSRNPERDYCFLLLMFRHGFRVTELCNLKLSDVDIDEKVLHVKRLKNCASGDHPLFNGEPRAIAAWLKERTKMHPHCDTLFVSERRKPLSRSMIYAMVSRVAEAAGLGTLNIHPHMLRHACGYSLINRGTDVRMVQSYLGHRSIQSTVRYTQLAPNRFANLW
jgi:type 1 fimbriae regulatory protein FimB